MTDFGADTRRNPPPAHGDGDRDGIGDGNVHGRGLWPDALERRRLWWLWMRQRRQPDRPRRLPAGWRRNRRLRFWWSLLQLWQQEPLLMSAAVLSVPLWAGWACWRLGQGF